MSETVKSKSLKTDSAPGTLYIVATPIGNLADMTFRAVDTLKTVDLIACEDTRVTKKLLTHYAIHTPTISYNDHNGAKRRPEILERLQQGQSIALVSDAGTPLISDPGYKLVAELKAADIPVVPIPGASSVITALSVSGLPTDRFTFAGFLPTKAQARHTAIRELAAIPTTLVLFESAQRLVTTLQQLHQQFGDREAVVARELTKKFETVRGGTFEELADYYQTDGITKGEIVILIAPPDAPVWDDETIDQLLRTSLKEMGVKQAATDIAQQTGLKRSDLYQRALGLKDSS